MVFSLVVMAQTPDIHPHGRVLYFPDLPDYQVLRVDLHQHTVFSDGSVWPDIRIQEALRDSLDALAVTEHLEYQPHKADLPHLDRNRSYVVTEKLARPYDLLIIPGCEITRDMPPGHLNALFIEDANAINIPDSLSAIEEAHKQGAFIFWNHPNWIAQQRDGIATLTDMHRQMIKDTLLHGIEIVNELTYSDEALAIAQNNGLTILGTSDIHGLVDYKFNIAEGGHRPITLVLAKEKSLESIKEALFAGRTIACYDHQMIGLAQHLEPLLATTFSIEKAEYQGPSTLLNVDIKNHSNQAFILDNRSGYTLHSSTGIIIVEPNTTKRVEVKTVEELEEIELKFAVLNAIVGKGQAAELVLKKEVKE